MPPSGAFSSAEGRAHRPHPRFPSRRAYLLLAAGVAAFAAYGSLVPFQPGSAADADFWDRVRTVLETPPPGRISRANVLANVLLCVPLGFLLMGALLVDRRSRLLAVPAALLTLASSFILGAGVELLQTFLADRVPSWIDVAAQTTGCAVGIVAWLLAGPSATVWLRDAHAGNAAERVLILYGFAWAFVSLAPFDLTVDPDHLRQRIDDGLITLVPFGNPAVSGWRLVWEVFATATSAAPLGALFAVRRAGGKDGWRMPRASAAWVAAVAAITCVELLQAFIRSHAADSGDVLSAGAGAALGVWAARRFAVADLGLRDLLDQRRGAMWALAAWALIVAAYHWMPFDVTVDRAAMASKLSRMSFVPFSGYWSGSYLRALNDLLVKVALAMPLGVLAALGIRRPAWTAMVSIAVGSLCFFTLVEAGQLLIPSRIPEPTDVFIGVSVAVLGAFLTGVLRTRDARTAASELPRQSQSSADAAKRA